MQDAIPHPHHVIEDLKDQICRELDIACEAIDRVLEQVEGSEYDVLEAIQEFGLGEPGLIQAYLDGECTVDTEWEEVA